MPCPTCAHTMEGIGEVPAVGGDPTFWCPRCGTIHQPARKVVAVSAPMLVDRCRDYQASLIGYGTPSPAYLGTDWRKLGIAEAINLPENRPT